jgi:DNA-binding response OmpR family regulator
MSRTLRRYRPEEAVSALVVTAHREGLVFLHQVFRDANWILHEAHSIAEALYITESRSVDLVVTDRDLPDGGWRRLMEALKTKSATLAPLIVTARLADDYLWAEVLNEGGFDVLAQPFDREEVIRVISAATRRSHNESHTAARAGSSMTLTAGA